AGQTDQEDEVPVGAEPRHQSPVVVVDDADHPDHRGRVDGAALGVVVEADIAADDRQVERATGVGEPAGGLLQLPVDLRLVRVAEVQAVGDGDRPGAGGDDVASRFGDRDLGTQVGVELAVAAV